MSEPGEGHPPAFKSNGRTDKTLIGLAAGL